MDAPGLSTHKGTMVPDVGSEWAGSPTGSASEAGRLRDQLLAFARDLNRIHAEERRRSRQLEEALGELEESYLATVRTLAFIVEARDAGVHRHLERSQKYAILLAERVAPDLVGDRAVEFGFLLHDVGKIGVPDPILTKPGPLSPEEFEVMKTHPLIGAQIVAPIKFLARASSVIASHHERWDGSGYPHGLRGEQIPLPARIFSVVDAFDAMTSDRPYRRAMLLDEALAEILAAAGRQFDPEIAKAFAELVMSRATGRDAD
jgi:ribonuclease P protein subunit RPR2